MKKLKSILFLSFLLVYSNSFCQTYQFEKELNVTAKFIEVDNLGNVYLVFDYNIYKLSSKGDTLYVYSAKNHGVITHLDVSIPQKPLLLFKESGKIVELDFTLTENPSPIYLFQKGILRPTLARHAFNNGGYWVYDASKFELINLDKSFNINTTSGNIQLLTSINKFYPSQMWLQNDQIYLADTTNGVLSFDVFGTFIKKFPVYNFSEITSLSNGFVYLNQNNLRFRNLVDEFLLEGIIVPKNLVCTRIMQDRVYFLSTKSVTIYVLKQDKNK